MEIDPRLRSESSTSVNPYRSSHQQHSPSSNHPSSTPQRLPPPSSAYPVHPDSSNHSPYTPQQYSHEGQHDTGGSSHGTPDAGRDPNGDPQKRPRACEACRRLKVRCEFDPNNPEGACKRCTKANRNCVVTQPSRKRQKKTDSRVAELEKKIDALTATLHATKSGHGSADIGGAEPVDGMSKRASSLYGQSGTYPPFFEPRANNTRVFPGEWEAPFPTPAEIEARKAATPPTAAKAGQKRKHQETDVSPPIPTSAPPSATTRNNRNDSSHNTNDMPRPHRSPSDDYTDAIDRGLLSIEMAQRIFKRYTDRMAPLLPAVVFPPETTMAEVRKYKPILFLSILGAASGFEHPELQRTLVKEVTQTFATRIMCNGEKTLEMIQSLLVSCIWYWPPDHFEELKFYQLVHVAAVMAIDINISKKTKALKGRPIAAMLPREHPWQRASVPDPEKVEPRRTWLACYLLCANTAMGLRRQNLIRWSSYLDECVHVLETVPDAAPTDKTLCQWVRSQHIAEGVGHSFSMDDPFATVTLSDSKVQYVLRGFERDLERWSAQVPVECRSPLLKMTEHVLNLYMHEIAMHVDHNVEEFKPPFTEESISSSPQVPQSLTPLTAVHINALSTCLSSIDSIFTTFLSIEVDIIRLLPVMHFVRVAYAVVALIKMYFAAAVEGSELGKVINKENMKIEYYLDALLDHFRAAAAEDKSRPSAKYLMVLVMLKTWFNRQKSGKKDSNDGENHSVGSLQKHTAPEPIAVVAGETIQPPGLQGIQQHQQQQFPQEYSPANTPLQLLSEVATGSQSRPESRTQFGQQTWSDQQYPYNDQMAQQQYNMNNAAYTTANIDPNLGTFGNVGYNTNLGRGLEKPVGWTMGDLDINYYSDDAFFGAVMDSVAGGGAPNMFDGF